MKAVITCNNCKENFAILSEYVQSRDKIERPSCGKEIPELALTELKSALASMDRAAKVLEKNRLPAKAKPYFSVKQIIG